MSHTTTSENKFVGPKALRLDLPGGSAQPAWWRWVIGTIVAVIASLLVCFLLAKGVSAADPSLNGYAHFQFSDYSRLTIVGVVAACIGWPIATLLSSAARRIYLWAAIVVVVVSLAPDAWILHLGQPTAGVVTLVAMHVGLGLVTYPAMVFIAPQRVRTLRSITT